MPFGVKLLTSRVCPPAGLTGVAAKHRPAQVREARNRSHSSPPCMSCLRADREENGGKVPGAKTAQKMRSNWLVPAQTTEQKHRVTELKGRGTQEVSECPGFGRSPPPPLGSPQR